MTTCTADPTSSSPPGTTSLENFAGLVDWSLQQLHPAALRTIAWPAEYTRQRSGNLSLRASRHAVGKVAELRAVDIAGPRLAIVNVFAYPSNPAVLPVFVAEFVRFGERGVVAVIDLKWVGDASARAPAWAEATLRGVHQDFAPLPYLENAPAWYQECRSGYDLFLRPQTQSDFDRVLELYRLVWRTYAAHLEATEPTEADPADLAAMREYQEHHRDAFPGRPFLERVFGKEWARDFLETIYFA